MPTSAHHLSLLWGNHNLVHLHPVYKPFCTQRISCVTHSEESEETEALRYCFSSTAWEELCAHIREDIDSITD